MVVHYPSMGRPKKSELDPVPTRERILNAAIEQFAVRGYDAVSIRDITRSLGLNEASLYNHFKSKAELLAEAFKQLEERLIGPGFAPVSAADIVGEGPFDLSEFFVAGSKRFFGATDRTVLLTWRILMTSQYAFEEARDSLRRNILDAPRGFFASILEALKSSGRLAAQVDCASYGRIISSIFFEYSFRANLDQAWEDEDEELERRMHEDLRAVAASIGAPGRKEA